MNWFDVAFAAIVVISIASGIRKGVSRSGFGFIAVVLAFLAAALFSPTDLRGFLFFFFGLIAVAAFGAFFLGRSLKNAGMTAVDRLLGGAFGLLNALLISLLAVVAVMAFAPPSARGYIVESRVAPYVARASCTVAQVLPDEMKYRVEDAYTELLQVLPPKFRQKIQQSTRTAGL
jgi:uncharacterized membrane protein required for colicin V production